MATHEVMPQDLPAKRRTWTPPAPPPQGRAPIPAARSIELQSPPGSVGEYVGRTLGYTVIFGVLGIFFQSRFPLALGAFLFVADEKFIQWAMAKVGIRFVPDTLGLAFIDAFVFFAGSWALITTWKDSAPAWLLPPAGSPWLPISIAALACAVLNTLSTMAVKKLLPLFGIEPKNQRWAELGLTTLALAVCALIFQWF